jgi:hypothetical protein
MTQHEDVQVQPQMPTPDPALKHLDFLVGKWKMEGETLEGPMGPATKMDSVESFTWLEGGFFLVHHWEGTFDMGGHTVIDTGYEFLGYDAERQMYTTHHFNSFGPYYEAGSTYQGDFTDGRLTLVGPARITRHLNEDGTISADSDVAVPGEEGQWLPFMKSTLTRIK